MRKNRYFVYALALFGIMLAHPAQAQWHKWHVGGGVGSLTYYGDLSDKFVNANLQELGYHFYVERLLTKKNGFYIRLETVNGHLIGSDRAPGGWLNGQSKHFDRSLNFRTKFHDVNTSFVYYFGNYAKRDREPFINAYVRAGIGVGSFDVYGDLKDAHGNYYNYWSDGTLRDLPENDIHSSDAQVISRDNTYETNLRELEVEKSYNKFKWQIPVGIGIRIRMGNVLSLILDAQYTYAMTDYLDNVGDKKIREGLTHLDAIYAADPAGVIGDQYRKLEKPVGMNDSYLYVSAGLTFNIGNNSKPKLKVPIFYPKSISKSKSVETKDAPTKKEQPATIIKEIVGKEKVEKDTVVKTSAGTIAGDVDSLTTLETSYNLVEDSIVGQEELPSEMLDGYEERAIKDDEYINADSVFVSVFYDNLDQWTEEDTLISDRVTSVDLDKAREGEYIVSYYSDEDGTLASPVLLKSDTVQFDIEERTILKDSVLYTSAQTLGGQDGDFSALTALETSSKLVEDSIVGQEELPKEMLDSYKEITQEDTIALKTIVTDTIYLEDSIAVEGVQIEERVQKDTLDRKRVESVVTPKEQVDDLIDTTRAQIDTLDLQKVEVPVEVKVGTQLDSVKIARGSKKQEFADSLGVQGQVRYKTDTTYSNIVGDLKDRMQELEDSTQALKDSIQDVPSPKLEKIKAQEKKLSFKDSLRDKRIEDLKSQLDDLSTDTIKTELAKKVVEPVKDTLEIKQIAIDSVKNQSTQELKVKLEELKQQPDTLTRKIKEVASEDSLKAMEIKVLKHQLDSLEAVTNSRDTVRTVIEKTIVEPVGEELSSKQVVKDSTQDHKIRELKRRLEELNQPRIPVIDTLPKQLDTTSSFNPRSQLDMNSMASARQPVIEEDLSDTERQVLLNKIEELNNQIARVEAKEEALAKLSEGDVLQRKVVTIGREKETKALDQKINELEAELKKMNKQQQDKMNVDLIMEALRTKDMKSARHASDNLSSNVSKKKQRTQPRVSIGFDYNSQPGFLTKKREEKKKEKEQSNTVASGEAHQDKVAKVDSFSTIVEGDTSSVVTSSDEGSVAKVQVPEKRDAERDQLFLENEKLRQQISNVQKNQDSVIAILNDILKKANQAVSPQAVVSQPAPELIEDNQSEVIEAILRQPIIKVFFAVGKSSVDNQFKNSLDRIGNQMKTYSVLNLELKGFADPTGNASSNLKLSEKRAQSVKNYLIQVHSINSSRITVLPVGQESNSQNLSYSRRVEVKLTN